MLSVYFWMLNAEIENSFEIKGVENHEKTRRQRELKYFLFIFFNQGHCYYHGNVRGYPDSSVSLSTCSGLRWANVLVMLELLNKSP